MTVTWIHKGRCFPPAECYTHDQYADTHYYDGGTDGHDDVKIYPFRQPGETGLGLSIVHISTKRWR